MGNTGSSSGRPHTDDTVDYGHLTPQGVYTGTRDWNHTIVTQLIVDRKLAPFYRPLEEYSDDWDDAQILAARREPPDSEATNPDASARPDSRDGGRPPNSTKRSPNPKDPARFPEAALYRDAVECPICFLYYPANINHSRCCDQTICTECFVQIKRIEPTTTHLVSEPAACPYCVQDNFGVVYSPPSWRTGIGSEGMTPPSWADSPRGSQCNNHASSLSAQKRRRKSFGHDSPEVVTTDQIRPDWEAKLASIRAAVARRANRRIVMRQVGDRLIPVGVTSGRVHTLPGADGADSGAEGESGSGTGSRRRRGARTNGPADITQLLGQIGLGGQDLEELMVMEAMRLSLLEHDEHQRREEEKRRKEATAAESVAGAPPEAGASAGPSNSAANALENASSSATSTVQGGDSCDGSLPRSCPRTPESGQASPSSSFGTVIDNLHGVSYSNEPLSSLGRVIGVEPPSSERNVQANDVGGSTEPGVVHSDVEYGLSSPDTGPDASDGASSNGRRV